MLSLEHPLGLPPNSTDVPTTQLRNLVHMQDSINRLRLDYLSVDATAKKILAFLQ